MRVHVQPRGARHERAFAARLELTCRTAGVEVVPTPEDADVSVVHGWDPLVEDQPTLYWEQGWLPRWHYQVSWKGINGESHLADPVLRRSSLGEQRATGDQLQALRRVTPPPGFAYADPTGGPVGHDLGSFILAPLQVEGDSNLRRARIRTVQGLVDRLSAYDPPLPVIYKLHPASVAQGQSPVLRRGQDRLTSWRGATVHQWLKHPGCVALVTLNSNAAHDALLWDVPVIVLEQGVWPLDGPFWSGLPVSWGGWSHYARSAGMEEARMDYARWLFSVQWTLTDAEDRDRVVLALETALEEPCR